MNYSNERLIKLLVGVPKSRPVYRVLYAEVLRRMERGNAAPPAHDGEAFAPSTLTDHLRIVCDSAMAESNPVLNDKRPHAVYFEYYPDGTPPFRTLEYVNTGDGVSVRFAEVDAIRVYLGTLDEVYEHYRAFILKYYPQMAYANGLSDKDYTVTDADRACGEAFAELIASTRALHAHHGTRDHVDAGQAFRVIMEEVAELANELHDEYGDWEALVEEGADVIVTVLSALLLQLPDHASFEDVFPDVARHVIEKNDRKREPHYRLDKRRGKIVEVDNG